MKNAIEENGKNKNTGLIITIIILLIALLGTIGYISYDKVFSKKENNSLKKEKNIENTEKEQLPLDSDLFNMITNEDFAILTQYQKQINGYEDFDAHNLLLIATKELKSEDFEFLEIKDGQSIYKLSFNKLLKGLTKYFPSDIKTKIDGNTFLGNACLVENINIKDGEYMSINKYIQSTDSYEVTFSVLGGGVGEAPSPDMDLTKITSAYRKKDKIYVTKKVIYVDQKINSGNDSEIEYNIYSDYESKNLIDTKRYNIDTISNEKIDVKDYLDKASEIIYVLKKDTESGNYVFESSTIKSPENN